MRRRTPTNTAREDLVLHNSCATSVSHPGPRPKTRHCHSRAPEILVCSHGSRTLNSWPRESWLWHQVIADERHLAPIRRPRRHIDGALPAEQFREHCDLRIFDACASSLCVVCFLWGVLAERVLLKRHQPQHHILVFRMAAHALVVGDRKSTRLNSSHVAISYAVLCLKKKN